MGSKIDERAMSDDKDNGFRREKGNQRRPVMVDYQSLLGIAVGRDNTIETSFETT
jgi:hypothetical protein